MLPKLAVFLLRLIAMALTPPLIIQKVVIYQWQISVEALGSGVSMIKSLFEFGLKLPWAKETIIR
jgi:hypothetical protein